jgi:hypothetical protein
MIRFVALLALCASIIGLGAYAATSPLAKAFGNTIVSTYPDGRTAELWLQPSGGYTAEGRRHDMSSGHWSLKGDKVCLKQAKPIWTPFTYCTAIPNGGVGTSWSAKAVTGEAIRVKLVAGHVSGRR